MPSLMLVLCLVLPLLGQASDLAREQRIRTQVEEAVLVGDPITLRTGELEFLAIHAGAETAETRGAVILLHGRGANPDWMDVIHPLRTGLPPHGWETLSLQMPVAAADAPASAYGALIPEAFPRIDFAVRFLTERNVRHLVILGHSLGARMGVEWLARDRPPEAVRAFVAVGLSADPDQPDTGTLGALSRIRLPLLDMFGTLDLDSVRHTAHQRAAAARKAENRGYRQLRIQGADHFFRGQDLELVTRVRAWLARVVSGAGQSH